jgi:hypothetical protein
MRCLVGPDSRSIAVPPLAAIRYIPKPDILTSFLVAHLLPSRLYRFMSKEPTKLKNAPKESNKPSAALGGKGEGAKSPAPSHGDSMARTIRETIDSHRVDGAHLARAAQRH